MAEFIPYLSLLLLLALLILIFQLLVTLRRIEGKISRLELPATDKSLRPENEAQNLKGSENGVFQEFLKGDASRALLPKQEQMKAYRAWRQAKGLNWVSGTAESEKISPGTTVEMDIPEGEMEGKF